MANTFEEKMKELETVVAGLEKGDLELDKAIEMFESGIRISKECNKKLEEAERKINILVEKDGKLEEETFEE